MTSRAFLFPLVLVIGMITLACTCRLPFARFDTVRGSGNVIEEERQVDDFNGVDLKSSGNLVIEVGDETALRVEAEDNVLPYLVTQVRGSTLEFSVLPDSLIIEARPAIYHLTVKPGQLETIVASGDGNVTAPELEAADFELEISGSGDVDLEGLATKKLDAYISGSGNLNLGRLQADQGSFRISGSGDVQVDDIQAEHLDLDISGDGRIRLDKGKLESQTISISGSGDYTADPVQSDQAEVRISGSGNTRLNAQDHLEIHISGSGSVEYVGRPTIDQTVSGSGRVKNIGE